jgi:hypothetical protein
MNHGLRHGIAQAIILSPILIFLVISVFWGLSVIHLKLSK